ncbi:hypothetical protein Pelo_15446 [Pelomyxa schiedti]|nr:hypothetical protein Pelo_15446 [Pelomyxa schiedti]
MWNTILRDPAFEVHHAENIAFPAAPPPAHDATPPPEAPSPAPPAPAPAPASPPRPPPPAYCHDVPAQALALLCSQHPRCGARSPAAPVPAEILRDLVVARLALPRAMCRLLVCTPATEVLCADLFTSAIVPVVRPAPEPRANEAPKPTPSPPPPIAISSASASPTGAESLDVQENATAIASSIIEANVNATIDSSPPPAAIPSTVITSSGTAGTNQTPEVVSSDADIIAASAAAAASTVPHSGVIHVSDEPLFESSADSVAVGTPPTNISISYWGGWGWKLHGLIEGTPKWPLCAWPKYHPVSPNLPWGRTVGVFDNGRVIALSVIESVHTRAISSAPDGAKPCTSIALYDVQSGARVGPALQFEGALYFTSNTIVHVAKYKYCINNSLQLHLIDLKTGSKEIITHFQPTWHIKRMQVTDQGRVLMHIEVGREAVDDWVAIVDTKRRLLCSFIKLYNNSGGEPVLFQDLMFFGSTGRVCVTVVTQSAVDYVMVNTFSPRISGDPFAADVAEVLIHHEFGDVNTLEAKTAVTGYFRRFNILVQEYRCYLTEIKPPDIMPGKPMCRATCINLPLGKFGMEGMPAISKEQLVMFSIGNEEYFLLQARFNKRIFGIGQALYFVCCESRRLERVLTLDCSDGNVRLVDVTSFPGPEDKPPPDIESYYLVPLCHHLFHVAVHSPHTTLVRAMTVKRRKRIKKTFAINSSKNDTSHKTFHFFSLVARPTAPRVHYMPKNKRRQNISLATRPPPPAPVCFLYSSPIAKQPPTKATWQVAAAVVVDTIFAHSSTLEARDTVLLKCLSQLSVEDLGRCCRVSRRWRKVAIHFCPDVWHNAYKSLGCATVISEALATTKTSYWFEVFLKEMLDESKCNIALLRRKMISWLITNNFIYAHRNWVSSTWERKQLREGMCPYTYLTENSSGAGTSFVMKLPKSTPIEYECGLIILDSYAAACACATVLSCCKTAFDEASIVMGSRSSGSSGQGPANPFLLFKDKEILKCFRYAVPVVPSKSTRADLFALLFEKSAHIPFLRCCNFQATHARNIITESETEFIWFHFKKTSSDKLYEYYRKIRNSYLIEPEPSCFTGDGLVTMADGTVRPVKELEVGDHVLSEAGNRREITKIESQPVNQIMKMCCVGGVWLTTGHPVLHNSEWTHPFEIVPVVTRYVDTLYNLELDSGPLVWDHSVIINGLTVCTLGKDCGARIRQGWPDSDSKYGTGYWTRVSNHKENRA